MGYSHLVARDKSWSQLVANFHISRCALEVLRREINKINNE